jgi:hypothetical protein
MDDQQARRCASALEVITLGTLGLLEAAAARGLVSLPAADLNKGRRKIRRAQEYPRKATSDFKASADITNTKKVRRLAAVCSSFASTAFQRFLPN